MKGGLKMMFANRTKYLHLTAYSKQHNSNDIAIRHDIRSAYLAPFDA